jgi:hypothetical protein
MNAVEIADAVAQLAEKPFSPTEFPFEFLAAFGNKETTITRLRKGDSNASDVAGGVLQKNNIHLAVCSNGKVGETLRNLRASPKTASAKAKFILATDGETLEAEELKTGDPLVCDFPALADNFGFFLPLAGISTVTEIKENPIDVRATGRLNKLYVELLRTNEDWQTEERRTDLNHFFARLIFCFFAEDTHIFHGDGMFTDTVTRMSNSDGSNVDFVLSRLFGAMNLNLAERKKIDLPLWADKFPYVNGGLFSDELPMPRFTRTARSYLLRAGELNWRQINPDIFGSMIQAVADDEERGALGMHYTSVPNILKVLNPLFLDDLREQLEKAGDHKASLLKLRERMSRIRVFDPACGSGNFLVIAYKGMRKIEAEINRRRGEQDRASEIPPTNFRGIEIRDFAAEVARLALVIAEYQCDVLHRGERLALAEFLPLNKENWIYRGNALKLDWTTVCPPTGTGVKVRADDLFGSELAQTEMDFANAGGETFICGNPPYLGSTWQSAEQKSDIRDVLRERSSTPGILDYVAGWFVKATDYIDLSPAVAAFVTTNSLCQGQSVSALWKAIYKTDVEIHFAYTSFKWANLASQNAGVTVAIVGIGHRGRGPKRIYEIDDRGETLVRMGQEITPYLTFGERIIIEKRQEPLADLPKMDKGNQPTDGGHLLMNSATEIAELGLNVEQQERFVRRFYGSQEFINGLSRYCLWIEDESLRGALQTGSVRDRVERVRETRMASPDKGAHKLALRSHQLRTMDIGKDHAVVIPAISSENRPYLPTGIVDNSVVISNKAYALYDAPLWNLALIASRLHWVWIGTVCVRMRTDFSYSNTLGWNTFPVPPLTHHHKEDLTRCAEHILLARESHFPATIADLYNPDSMPDDLRRAHERNDETLERIYIGRRFRNDTERLEKLFEMYTAMTAKESQAAPTKRRTKKTTVAPTVLLDASESSGVM